MFDKNSLINLLESNSISYKITEHKPLFTVEDSKNLEVQLMARIQRIFF